MITASGWIYGIETQAASMINFHLNPLSAVNLIHHNLLDNGDVNEAKSHSMCSDGVEVGGRLQREGKTL